MELEGPSRSEVEYELQEEVAKKYGMALYCLSGFKG